MTFLRCWARFYRLSSTQSFALALALLPSIATAELVAQELRELGQVLFFDTNLSLTRTQSCATCHDPDFAFVDPRDNGIGTAASVGSDGISIGDRNTPSVAYASLTPNFQLDDLGNHRGGLFLDGRAQTLSDQAVEPILNPLEMALPDTASLAQRIAENPYYVEVLKRNFSQHLFDDHKAVSIAVGTSLSAFEQTDFFSPFDSKYDRFLRGEYEMSSLEEFGRVLFFSPLTNCTSCHLLNTSSPSPGETFSNYRYHNIGLPVNEALRSKNGRDAKYRDRGLLGNPAVDDRRLDGMFKVPSLRNVAVTAPYMHNGVFRELKTAIIFYNKYIVHSKKSRTNPESLLPWGKPEVPATIDVDLLNQGQPIDDGRARALIAFLKTLTDKRYEAMLEKEPSS
jgi:cytochrome c peroxidase